MGNKNMQLWAAVLLLIGGLVHLIPTLYVSLTQLTGGTSWIQIVVGALSVVMSLVLFSGEKNMGTSASSSGSRPTSFL